MKPRNDSNSKNKKFCECGCGYQVKTRFVSGHNTGKREKNRNWMGGKTVDKRGYILINIDHHFRDKTGHVREHRLVWEQHNKAILMPWAIVHHKNGIVDDNRIENLEIVNKHNHIKLHKIAPLTHQKKDMSDRNCFLCKSKNTYFVRTRNHYAWYRHPITNKKWLCRNCYRRI